MAFRYNKKENETTTTSEPYSPTAQANLTEQSSYEGNKTSPNDMIFFPGCSLSSLFDQFWSKCLVGEFLQLKKFDGPKQCQSSWHNMFKCGYLIMNDSLNGYPEWKVEYFPRELLRQFKNIGGFDHYASNYYNGTNTELDIFCYHAPLGLNFPKMSKFSLAQTSDSFCKDDTFSKVAQIFAEGYRGQVWAQYQGDIYGVFQEMTRRVFETIHTECSMRNAQRGFEDFITVLPKLFEKAYETMYADSTVEGCQQLLGNLNRDFIRYKATGSEPLNLTGEFLSFAKDADQFRTPEELIGDMNTIHVAILQKYLKIRIQEISMMHAYF